MEITCTRCHQTIEDGSTYCAMCGLPQLVYQADATGGTAQPERRVESPRDAASIAWKPAMRLAAMLAVPAGMIFAVSILNETSFLGLLLLMAAAAAWVIALYKRNQQSRWITIGAGARIGLVTGIMSAWTTAAIAGLLLFGARYWFGYGKAIDDFWTALRGPMLAQGSASGADPQMLAQTLALMLSPEGRAGFSLAIIAFMAGSLLVFAIAGGALGARFLSRPRQPEI